MATRPSFRPIEPLPELWREWARLVGQFAGRNGSAVQLTEAAYGALYARITALCDEQADASSEAREFFRHLGEVVRPWVTLNAFRLADAELLSELHARATALDRDLHGGRAAPLELPGWVVPLTVWGLAGVCLLAIAWWVGLFERVADWVRAVRLWAIRGSPSEWVWVMVIVVVLLLVCGLIFRPRRS